jgi:hypothetical protein
VTSLTAVEPATLGQHGGVAFTTTHWSVVLEAQGESPAAQEALEKLCRTYWRPIFAFLRRQGVSPPEAEDITQGFFAQLLERSTLMEICSSPAAAGRLERGLNNPGKTRFGL